tara:strand:- start:1004 stop:1642 length:639 start_codon:yes stop_codon:yes gene_type:complete
MPETSRTFANLEIKQGEDYELTIAMDSGYTTANKTYRARIVKDFDGTTFASSGGTAAFEAMTIGSSDGNTMTGVTTDSPSAGTVFIFTKSSHGFSAGDTVSLSGFTELTTLNGLQTQIATVPNSESFTLDGVFRGSQTTENTGGTVTNLSGDSSASITVSLTAAETEALPDDFEGYWDLVEKDTSSGSAKYTRQAEGEVLVINVGTPISSFS